MNHQLKTAEKVSLFEKTENAVGTGQDNISLNIT